MTSRKDNEDFKNSTKCWICDIYIDDDVTVRFSCHTIKKYKGFAHRDCNINVKLNHKFSIVFHNLKNHDSHLVMEELGKLNFKFNVTPNKLEK